MPAQPFQIIKNVSTKKSALELVQEPYVFSEICQILKM